MRARACVADLKSICAADNPYTVTFTQNFGTKPNIFAAFHTHDGGDPSHLRREATSKASTKIWVEEETCSDAELAHTTERIAVLAIESGVAAAMAKCVPETCHNDGHWIEVGERAAFCVGLLARAPSR